jgi:hypothetical protein
VAISGNCKSSRWFFFDKSSPTVSCSSNRNTVDHGFLFPPNMIWKLMYQGIIKNLQIVNSNGRQAPIHDYSTRCYYKPFKNFGCGCPPINNKKFFYKMGTGEAKHKQMKRKKVCSAFRCKVSLDSFFNKYVNSNQASLEEMLPQMKMSQP